MVRFLLEGKRLIGILYLSYKLRERQKERERESGETGREGEKQKERGERQTEKERSSWCHCGKVA